MVVLVLIRRVVVSQKRVYSGVDLNVFCCILFCSNINKYKMRLCIPHLRLREWPEVCRSLRALPFFFCSSGVSVSV